MEKISINEPLYKSPKIYITIVNSEDSNKRQGFLLLFNEYFF